MKSALNGGLNLSIRDGWWDECYDGSNGWAIPTADGIADPLRRDELEAAALYDLLGQQIAPLFYDRDATGVPKGWMSRVWHTLDTLGPRVQASRMVREYVESCYQPAARTVAAASRDSYEGAKSLAGYRKRIDTVWRKVRILDTELTVEPPEDLVVGNDVRVRAHIDLAGLDPSEVEVQAVVGRVADTDDLHEPIAVPMTSTSVGGFGAVLRLPHAGSLGYTVRILPCHPLLASPAELGLVIHA
jgi:starch phosphorylase